MPVARLLDTSICIYIARSRPPSVARRFARAAPGSLGMSLVSNKLGEFQRVPGLKLENWV